VLVYLVTAAIQETQRQTAGTLVIRGLGCRATAGTVVAALQVILVTLAILHNRAGTQDIAASQGTQATVGLMVL